MEGGVRGAGRGRGWVFFFENPRRGGGVFSRTGLRGQEGVCGELRTFGGGGGLYFFSGPKCPPNKNDL